MAKRTPTDRDDDLDTIFRALAHPIRRDVLEQLADGPRTVGELAGAHDVSLAAVSNHLRTLEDAGLAEFEKDGRVRRGHLAVGPLDRAREWLSQDHFTSGDERETAAVHPENIDR